MMRCAIIRIPVTTLSFPRTQPIRRMLLESVLGGILFQIQGHGDDVLQEMQKIIYHAELGSEKVPCASQAILEGPILTRRISSIVPDVMRALRQPEVMDQMRNTPGFRATSQEGTHRGKNKLPVAFYEELSVVAVNYLFIGDVEAVLKVFRSTRRIGSMRARGSGEIDPSKIQVEILPDTPLFGIIGGRRLLRPIPTRLEQHLVKQADGELIWMRGGYERWYPPYHLNQGREPCLVPYQTDTVMVVNDMGEFLS